MNPDVLNLPLTSWSSIFAGVVVILITQLTLSLLGLGIGLVSVHPKNDQYPVKALTTGSAIWWVVSSLVAVYAGAWIAARLANVGPDAARLHGVVTWATAMLISMLVFTKGAGMIASGAIGMVTRAIKTLGTIGTGAVGLAGTAGATAAAKGPDIASQVNQMFPQISGELQTFNNRIKKYMNDQQAKQEIADTAGYILKKGPQNIDESDKQRLQTVITKYTDIPETEARTKVDQLVQQVRRVQTQAQQQVQQTVEQTKVAAEEATKVLSAAI